MTDTTAIQERIGELCHSSDCLPWGAVVARFTAATTILPWRPS